MANDVKDLLINLIKRTIPDRFQWIHPGKGDRCENCGKNMMGEVYAILSPRSNLVYCPECILGSKRHAIPSGPGEEIIQKVITMKREVKKLRDDFENEKTSTHSRSQSVKSTLAHQSRQISLIIEALKTCNLKLE